MIQKYITIKTMETCINWNSQYKRSNKYNLDLANTRLAVNNQYYCRQWKQKRNLAEKKTYLQSDEHKSNRKKWNCDICEKQLIINTKSKQINSKLIYTRKNKVLLLKKVKL